MKISLPALFTTIAVSIISIPVIMYWLNFSDGHFSDSQETWAHFGDFMNIWVSLASLVLLTGLSYLIHRNEIAIEEAKIDREKAFNRPLIIVKRGEDIKDWRIKNIGNGIALNILFSHSPVGFERWQQNLTALYSLSSGEEFLLTKNFGQDDIRLVYLDVSDNIISSEYRNKQMKFHIDVDLFHRLDKNEAQSLNSLLTGLPGLP